jgi:hypothetical protein
MCEAAIAFSIVPIVSEGACCKTITSSTGKPFDARVIFDPSLYFHAGNASLCEWNRSGLTDSVCSLQHALGHHCRQDEVCGIYYACKNCHDALANHTIEVWPRSQWEQPAVLCRA